jgi:lipopolysaccharide transport system permease protein
LQDFSISPREMAASIWRHRGLARALVKREVVGRYRGSFMGMAWSFFNPLFMLIIYTFVFSSVFKARWGSGDESKVEFAILLFVGMIVHGLFAECANRAPTLILSNATYVKKVVFPLEILPWVAFGSALFHATISVSVLLFAQIVLRQQVPWTIVLFPLVLVPLVLTTMGVSWFLAALGMYIRDIGQMIGVFTTALLFLSPVMYPTNAVPEGFRRWIELNPLTFIIEEGRNTLIFGRVPDVGKWTLMVAAGAIVAWAGFAWFQKARKGFADVV